MTPTAPAPCAYSDRQASCPGLEETLQHSSENGLTRRKLAFHIAKCPTCLAATLRCLRAGCPVAGRPFAGEAGISGVTAGWDGLLRTWCGDVFKRFDWLRLLSEVDVEFLREETIYHAWRVLLTDEKFDPEHVVADGRPAGPLIKEVIHNKALDLKRRRDISTTNTNGGFDVYTRGELPERSAIAAEDEVVARSQIDAVFAIFRERVEDLADKPDQQFVIDEWLNRRTHGGELTQDQLAELLQQDRKRRSDGSAHETRPNQGTISRWILQSRVAIAEKLGDPKRGIDPSYRDAALKLIAPNKHADKTDPPEAKK